MLAWIRKRRACNKILAPMYRLKLYSRADHIATNVEHTAVYIVVKQRSWWDRNHAHLFFIIQQDKLRVKYFDAGYGLIDWTVDDIPTSAWEQWLWSEFEKSKYRQGWAKKLLGFCRDEL